MIKKRIFIFIVIMGLILPAMAQVEMLKTSKTMTLAKRPLTLARSKIKVEGFAAYYGNAKYISVHIKLTYKGRPLSTPVVRLNNSIIRNSGNGEYNGALTPYNNIRVGNRLVFTAEFPKRRYFTLSDPPFRGKIVLARYTINNIINWVYPRPRQSIKIKNVLFIPFRWDFTGTPRKTELFIKDDATNKKILSKIINSESLKVNPSLFKSGKKYVMGLWAFDPLGDFKISKTCDASSKVVFYFSDLMTFKTDNEFSLLKPILRKR